MSNSSLKDLNMNNNQHNLCNLQLEDVFFKIPINNTIGGVITTNNQSIVGLVGIDKNSFEVDDTIYVIGAMVLAVSLNQFDLLPMRNVDKVTVAINGFFAISAGALWITAFKMLEVSTVVLGWASLMTIGAAVDMSNRLYTKK